MENINFKFWKMAYDMECVGIEMLREAVKTEKNRYGDITPEEFKVITGEDF
ncbi:XkdX family protein [Clostridium sardiniense]|uniref:XkdX family protein n=1 Tax=Clostridium sardiniense TaxID=29369 RepID=A0ABS7KW47_CLOSR|nr:XkdX family protein [Clostridium sardiniense]MBY0755015.1 XkdX family protein [Clostridium sardiniense]MDQ0459131.1 hypothetical protein [Clostridium sardiniense]